MRPEPAMTSKGFVSLIGVAFVFELALVRVDWASALRGTFVPSMPRLSIRLST